MVAKELLDAGHPLHRSFKAYCEKKGVVMTRRQAREYLKKFPNFRKMVEAK